MKHAFRNKAR